MFALALFVVSSAAYLGLARQFDLSFLGATPLQQVTFGLAIGMACVFAVQLRALYSHLADRESMFRMLTEEISETIWRHDKHNIVTYISPADERMRGFKASEVIGRPVFEMLTEAGGALLREAAASGKQSMRLPARHKYGRQLWIEVTSTAELDSNGNIVGYHGISREVTESVLNEMHEAFRGNILEMIAGGENPAQILESIVTGIEKLHPGTLCSILLMADDGRHLGNGIAPSLPDSFNRAVDGIEIGVGQGSCGTAAFLGDRVIVEDIATHPYWTRFREVAGQSGLRSCWAQPIRSASNQILGTFAIYHRTRCKPTDADIQLIEQSARLASIAIRRQKLDNELRDSHLFTQSILDSVNSQIAVIDDKGIIVSVNEAWRRFALENSKEPGTMPPNTDIGANYLQICRETRDTEAGRLDPHSGIQAVLQGRLPTYSVEYPCHSAEQKRWFMMTVTPLRTWKKGAVIVHNNISDRKLIEERIARLAFYDPLTNLPNRRLLQDRLARAIAGSRRSGNYCAVIFLDLDNFKPLNDEHGHSVGDLLLIEAANRLQNCLRESDTVARFGGDEFVVMLDQLSPDEEQSIEQARIIALKIRKALNAPYILTDTSRGDDENRITHHCTVSIGIRIFDNQESSPENILKQADTAMYQAKQSGRDTIKLFRAPLFSNAFPGEFPGKLIQLNWHESYDCGNALIDAQHRKLFETTNLLLSAILHDQASMEVAALIETLLSDVIQHFEDEEKIMSEADVPDRHEHAAAHRMLVDNARKLISCFHAGTLGAGELFEFLAHDVVARHLLAADRKYAPYLKAQPGQENSCTSPDREP